MSSHSSFARSSIRDGASSDIFAYYVAKWICNRVKEEERLKERNNDKKVILKDAVTICVGMLIYKLHLVFEIYDYFLSLSYLLKRKRKRKRNINDSKQRKMVLR